MSNSTLTRRPPRKVHAKSLTENRAQSEQDKAAVAPDARTLGEKAEAETSCKRKPHSVKVIISGQNASQRAVWIRSNDSSGAFLWSPSFQRPEKELDSRQGVHAAVQADDILPPRLGT
jgi:hypothetical protein